MLYTIFLWSLYLQNKGFSDFLAELKQKNNIIDIVSNYVRLEQKGRRFWGCCPFHSEKTPSFSVNEEDGIYYCFGCKENGDVIKFVQKMENVDFMDAVKILADRVGLEVPTSESSDERQKRQKAKTRILSALDYAYKHYVENLYAKDAVKAQEYVKLRKFTKRELEDFKIGYSKNWSDMPEYLLSKGFTEQEMIEAGICAKKNEHLFDVLGERLVFPIFNSFNECIGFSARALEKTDFAKYKNTAETAVFQKGKVVYGINIIKSQKQQQLLDKIILVEGQMDVIAMHKAGFKGTVACMGTALTKDHVQELKRFCKNIYLCFDGDGAGLKATLRAIDMFRNEDVELKVVRLYGGKDPDEVLQNLGKEKLQNMIDSAMPYMEFLIEYHRQQCDMQTPEGKNKFVKNVLAEIRKLGEETLFEPYLEKVRDISKVPLDVLRRNVKTTTTEGIQKPVQQMPIVPSEKGDEKAIKFVLASLLHKCEFVDKQIDYRRLLDGYEKILDIIDKNLPLSAIYDEEGAETNEFLVELINFNFSIFEEDSSKYFKECLWKIAEQKLKNMQTMLNEKFKQCENLNERSEIAMSLGKIAQQIRNKSMEEFYGRRESR